MRVIEFKSADQETVRGVLHEPTTPRPHPAIIFAHGLLSTHEEYGNYPEKFCERGYLTLAIDFRGHGASEGQRGLMSSERNVQDLRHALDYIEAHPGIDNDRIALIGHSFGGDAVLCTAARDERVRAVVAGATVGRLRDEIGGVEMLTYRIADAVNRFQKQFTHKPLYLPYRVTYKHIFSDAECRRRAEAAGFLQKTVCADFIPVALLQDAIACARNVKIPAMIIQGELDAVVSHHSTRAVYDALASTVKEWHEVKGSGHSIWTDCQGEVTFEYVAAWIEKQLK
jgi:dipeptidyl aminopeptidase/acylaminoacyl peptidase